MTQIGCHLSIAGGIDKAIDRALEVGASALQVFVSPNQGSSPGKPISKETAKTIKEILQNTGIYFVVHGKYILNFTDSKVKWYHGALVSDLRKVNQLGDEIGVVIHQGKNKPELKLSRKEALKNYVNGVKAVLDETSDIPNPIYLENSCHAGNELGYTLEELAEIYHMFEPKYQKRLGFCLDTCHIFVAGTLRFGSVEEVDAFFEKFDQLIGLEKLRVIHFNDSKVPFNGNHDRHENLLEGFITNPGAVSSFKTKKVETVSDEQRGTLAGLKRLVGWAKLYEIPLILETPREDRDGGVPCEQEIMILNEWVDEAEVPKKKKTTNKSKITIKKRK